MVFFVRKQNEKKIEEKSGILFVLYNIEEDTLI